MQSPYDGRFTIKKRAKGYFSIEKGVYMIKISKRSLSTVQIVLLSFLIAILIGSILLALPISSASGTAVPYIDALFTATSATCVTGLVTLTTYSTWSIFGQIVILILIQIGGLGVITMMTGVMLILNRKIGISDRMLIQDSFNLNSMSGLVAFVKKVLLGTVIIEVIGAIAYMFVFIPEFGPKGIWISFFNSVSAFCNAGIDIIGEASLCGHATNVLVNTTTSVLIILGGIGYIVWWDVVRVMRSHGREKSGIFKNLSLHSKIAIVSTLILIIGGAVLYFIFEYNNPLTIKDMSVFDKIQVSFFQSVTTRTAGFATVPQENLTNASAFLTLLLMFIGGSPVGTAGGVKTVTVTVLAFTAASMIKSKSHTALFGRSISKQFVSKAITVVIMSFSIMYLSTVLLSAVTDAPALDIIFEAVSATGTVGLSRNLTPSLNLAGKMIMICTMYCGRVGPISLAIAFKSSKTSTNIIQEPTEEVTIG